MADDPATSGTHYEDLYTEEYFNGSRSFFYRVTGGYRDLQAVFDGYAADVRRHAPAGGRLLDIGCAYGFLLRRFADDFETFGLDVSQHAVERARQVSPRSTVAVHNILEPLPFDDTSFDVVTMTDILEHVPGTDRILAEVARVCRPGAILYVTTPNRNLIRRTLYRIPDRMEHHTNLLSYRELGDLLGAAGFETVERFTSINALFKRHFTRGVGPEQTYIARRR
ncbi:MAG: methyltransferase domain-containing protein [Planctomycetes bacterium]|nr:methyltransferase domain-containing protein [Planctomycetota bacterium]